MSRWNRSLSPVAMPRFPIAQASESRSTRAGCGAASKNSKEWREPPETSKRTFMNDTGRPDDGYRFIGKPLPRKEDARLTTGKGRFTDDFSLDGQAYAMMVRSPHPHARIVSIDTSAAKTMPGVLAVLTGEDCEADALTPIPHSPVPSTKFD